MTLADSFVQAQRFIQMSPNPMEWSSFSSFPSFIAACELNKGSWYSRISLSSFECCATVRDTVFLKVDLLAGMPV